MMDDIEYLAKLEEEIYLAGDMKDEMIQEYEEGIRYTDKMIKSSVKLGYRIIYQFIYENDYNEFGVLIGKRLVNVENKVETIE